MKPAALHLLLAATLLLPPSAAAQTDGADYRAIEDAILAHRLVQARAMLSSIKIVGTGLDQQRLEALSAELALAEGRNEQALGQFSRLIEGAPENCRLTRGAGIAAMRLGRAAVATPYLEQATAACAGSWEGWNALGIAYDFARRWGESAAAYEKAIALQPQNATILNNFGYSAFLQQKYQEATYLFIRAAAIEPGNARIANNLDIARASQGEVLARHVKEDGSDRLAERLNNAGYAAYLAGDRKAARAWLSQSLFAGDVYFGKAASNLRLVEEVRE